MSTSYVISPRPLTGFAERPRRVLVTGSAGRIGSSFVSHRDLNQLLCRSIDDERIQFAVFHGLSGNRFNRMDIGTAHELLGYEPTDDFTELNRKLADLDLRSEVTPTISGTNNKKQQKENIP